MQVHDLDGMLKLCLRLAGQLELLPLLRLAEPLQRYAGPAGHEMRGQWLHHVRLTPWPGRGSMSHVRAQPGQQKFPGDQSHAMMG